MFGPKNYRIIFTLVWLRGIQEQAQTLPESVVNIWRPVHRERGKTCWDLTMQKLRREASLCGEQQLAV